MNEIKTLNLMLDVLKKINDLSLNDEATTAIHHGLELLHRKQKRNKKSIELLPKPLTEEQLEKGRDQTFSINNPFCPCDSKTFSKVARWVESAHGIKE